MVSSPLYLILVLITRHQGECTGQDAPTMCSKSVQVPRRFSWVSSSFPAMPAAWRGSSRI